MARIPLSLEVKKVLKMLMGTLLVLVLGVSGFYFFKATDTAERGYQLRETDLKKQHLEAENRILKQQVLDAQSLVKLSQSGAVSHMRPQENQIFVKPQAPLKK